MNSASLAKVLRRVDDWKLKLIDLSRRNRLVNFRPTRSSSLRFQRPGIDAVFERLVVKDRAWAIWEPPEDSGEPRGKARPGKTQLVPEGIEAPQLRRVLRNLARRSASEYRERGVRILYVAFGMLSWREGGSNQPLMSPIVLTPVELTRKTTRDPYTVRVPAVEDEAILNPALRLKLQYEHKIELPPLPDWDEEALTGYLAEVREAIRETGWEVEASVHLGLFSFHKLVMYQDLIDNVDTIIEHPLIGALAGVTTPPVAGDSLPVAGELDRLDPKEVFQVLDADSSQQLCIQYALAGQSFVMHGPPGTGKSQTIANMIAEFIARGKNVLFVSEKMAALEVVYSRLKARNLDDYCLELHSHKANKREVVAELSRSLNEHLKARGAMTDEELERLLARRDQLNEYVGVLHSRREPIGLTPYQIFGTLTSLEETPLLPTGYGDFDSLDQGRLLELEDRIRRLSNAWRVVEEGDAFPWKGCTEERFTPETRSQWIHLLESAAANANEMESASSEYVEALGLETPGTIEEYERLQRLTEIIGATPRPPQGWLVDADLREIRSLAEKSRTEWGEYWASVGALGKNYDTRLLIMPPGTAGRIEEAWKDLGDLLTPVSRGDGGLLRNAKELEAFLRRVPGRLREMRGSAERISSILGLKGETQTLERITHVSELARMCEAEHRPMRSWLDRSSLEEATQLVETLKIDHFHRAELRGRLEAYDDAVLSLELDEIIEYLEGPGSSFLRVLMPSYYRIKGAVSKVTRDGAFPETAVEDLKAARGLRGLLERLDANLEGSRKTLGVYYQGEEPDFDGAEEALKSASKALRIAGTARAPRALRDNLSALSKPVEDLLRHSEELSSSLSAWRADSRKLRGLIPSRRMPNSGASMRKSSLLEVESWAVDSLQKLTSLSRLASETLATRLHEHPATYGILLNDLRTVERLQRFEDEVDSRSEEMRGVFGQLYSGLRTDWDGVLGALGWTRRLIRVLPRGVPERLAGGVSQGGPPLPPDPLIGARWSDISSSLDSIDDRFERESWPEPRRGLTLERVRTSLGALRSRIDDLQTWVDFKAQEAGLGEAGLGGFLESLVAERVERGRLVDVFRKAMYQGLLDAVFREDVALEAFRGKDHEQLIEDFQDLDRRFIQLASQRVIEIANEQKPQGVFVQAPDSEITVLMREAAKKRRHMPLRNLFERIPNLVRRLKPCLMMSPISVSQFLIPGGIHFDLVVFDEASQIYTEDAVGSIYRGDTLVVAGDPKQLPPTPFFQHTLDEDFDWDEDAYEFDVFDSVLDECMSIGLPVQMLRWHYRSKHDSLISFSNDRFYNGNLVLFPASRMGSSDLGLEFVHVKDGVYDRGGRRNNVREAEVVADLVFEHFERRPEKTLGVVTFSLSQMNTVQDTVEARLRERPRFEKFFVEDRLDGFFVKNLENVQGDERDVMIFSVGYGFDENGRITMNFGPLNKQGGERRLNVAVTRAREKVVLVSSIKYDDIKLESTQAEGVHSLHHYMRYAERRPRNLDDIAAEEVSLTSPLDDEVAEEVRRLGYRTVPWVGSGVFRVDLGVVDPDDPGRFILGIMCDGENYVTADTARDRDRLRIQVLENLGWRIHRVWSPDWVQRRETEAKRLAEALKDAAKGPSQEARKEAKKLPARPKRNSVKKVKVVDTPPRELPEVEPYRFVKLKPEHLFTRYSPEHRERYLRQYHSEVKRLLPPLVRGEGPIHVELAFRRMNSAFRLSRATGAFRAAFQEEVDAAGKDRIEVRGDFLWPKGRDTVRVRAPVEGVDESFRPIEYVPPEEALTALTMVAEHSLGIREETLLNETARLLGFKRMGSNILEALRVVYLAALDSGALRVEHGLVVLKNQ
ncbi:DUF4011 domain-containing protein [Candidatus Bathyarchaeota archaeon]|nr:DUF4011 domain-containing protein [Candidatus Bathyarchaeota archaeon]